jgi:hypothetical protein
VKTSEGTGSLLLNLNSDDEHEELLQSTRDIMLASKDWEAISPDIVECLGEWLKQVSDVRKLQQSTRHRFLVIILDLV